MVCLRNKCLRHNDLTQADVCLLEEKREKRLFRHARHDFEAVITLVDEIEHEHSLYMIFSFQAIGRMYFSC